MSPYPGFDWCTAVSVCLHALQCVNVCVCVCKCPAEQVLSHSFVVIYTPLQRVIDKNVFDILPVGGVFDNDKNML